MSGALAKGAGSRLFNDAVEACDNGRLADRTEERTVGKAWDCPAAGILSTKDREFC